MDKILKRILFFLPSLYLLFLLPDITFCKTSALIQVSLEKTCEVNKLVFGSNLLGWSKDNGRKNKNNLTIGGDYGYGVWNPKLDSTVEQVKRLGKNAGISIFRFNGMVYNWQDGIKTQKEDSIFHFGIEERIKVCHDISSESIICVPYIFDGTKGMENLFNYLMGKADEKLVIKLKTSGPVISEEIRDRLLEDYVKTINGKFKYENLRAINGHFDPYEIKYVEIGNEIYFVYPPKKYAKLYIWPHFAT